MLSTLLTDIAFVVFPFSERVFHSLGIFVRKVKQFCRSKAKDNLLEILIHQLRQYTKGFWNIKERRRIVKINTIGDIRLT